MRVTKYSPFGAINKITVTGSLVLNVDPTQNNQLANKASVDDLFTNKILKAGDTLTTPSTQTSAPTQDNHSIRKIDVTNRISQADNDPNNLTKSQIDDLLSVKISKSGDAVQGTLSYNTNYTADANLVTKKTIDDFLAPTSGTGGTGAPVTTGTVIEYGSSTTPSGYLRLNGAAVSKTTYSGLYKAIGDNFSTLYPGGGIPWKFQYGFNPSTQSDITGWVQENNSLAQEAAYVASLVTEKYIYILGGYGSSGTLNTIQRATFDANGNLTTPWSSVGALPASMYSMGYVAAKNRFYLIGGRNDSSFYSSVYSVSINADGTLGDFRAETTLPTTVANAACFVIKNRLYVVGGQNSNGYLDTAYKAIINNDGTLGSWTTLPNLPIGYQNIAHLIIKDRIYFFASYLYSGNLYLIYFYTKYDSNGDIGSWIRVSDIPNNIVGSAIVCTDNRVFIIGGYNQNNNQYTDASHFTGIDIDGTIGAWNQISNGPIAATGAQSVIAGNKIYFIGGYDGSNYLNSVYSANFTSGIIDYAPYYDIYPNISNTTYEFNLPDYSSKEAVNPGLYYYIKT
jgi:N-acetylneuraminic acid mutarotase